MARVDVMVTLWNDESRADALALAAELRGVRDCASRCIRTRTSSASNSSTRSSRNVPFVAIVGDDERGRGRSDA